MLPGSALAMCARAQAFSPVEPVQLALALGLLRLKLFSDTVELLPTCWSARQREGERPRQTHGGNRSVSPSGRSTGRARPALPATWRQCGRCAWALERTGILLQLICFIVHRVGVDALRRRCRLVNHLSLTVVKGAHHALRAALLPWVGRVAHAPAELAQRRAVATHLYTAARDGRWQEL